MEAIPGLKLPSLPALPAPSSQEWTTKQIGPSIGLVLTLAGHAMVQGRLKDGESGSGHGRAGARVKLAGRRSGMGTKSNTMEEDQVSTWTRTFIRTAEIRAKGRTQQGHKEQHNEDESGTDKEDKDRRRHVKGQKSRSIYRIQTS